LTKSANERPLQTSNETILGPEGPNSRAAKLRVHQIRAMRRPHHGVAGGWRRAVLCHPLMGL